MKSLRFVITLACFLYLISSAARAQTSPTPIEFNDRLTAITDSLYARGQEWGQLFNEVHPTRGYAALRPTREGIEEFVTTSIARVKAMPDVENSKALRMAMISYLEFEKQLIAEAFKPLEALTTHSTKKEMNAAFARLKTMTEAENGELQKVVAAQEAYAAANGFTVAPPEEEE